MTIRDLIAFALGNIAVLLVFGAIVAFGWSLATGRLLGGRRRIPTHPCPPEQ